jgi:putative transposase
MRKANPLWGAPRIHGELLKLGINISQATVGRWMPWRPKVPSPTWWSFLRNHLPESWRAHLVRTVTGRVSWRIA